MGKAKHTLERFSKIKYRMIFEGILVGLLTGLYVSVFRVAIEKSELYRNELLSSVKDGSISPLIIVALAVVVALILYLIVKVEPNSAGSGIPQIKGELLGEVKEDWKKVIIGKFIGGVLAIGMGMSLGREGPSIQLGAMVGKGTSDIGKKLPVEEKFLITCGAGAGLAGAFFAPLAGVIFALEELHKNFSTEVLLSTMSAAVVSNFVSSSILGLDPIFDLYVERSLPLNKYWTVILLGIALGLLGTLYNWVMLKTLDLYKLIPYRVLRISLAVGITAILWFLLPQVLGSGHIMVHKIALGEQVISLEIGQLDGVKALLVALVIFFVAKLLFSAISFGSGVPGGIFLPLLVLGAIAGGIFSLLMSQILGTQDAYLANFIIIGMTGLFASIVKAPITGVILITEMTGDFGNFLPLTIVALVSYVVSDIAGSSPIYDSLLDRMIEQDDTKEHHGSRATKKVIVEGDVYMGSKMDGGTIEDMGLPQGALVISVERAGKEIVPDGATILQGGDKLVVLCAEAYQSQITESIDKLCKKIG